MEIKMLCWNPHTSTMYDPMPIVDFTLIRINGHVIRLWTGLKDKNGKEIYEGDVVKMEDGTGYVFYDDMEAAFLMEYHPSYFLRIGCGDEIEVLGNIYENPELTAAPPIPRPHDK